MVSSGMLRRAALVRTGVSEEPSASVIRATRIGELGTTLAVTSNRRTLHAACCLDWIGLAQDRYRLRALVNVVMNLRVR
jgi:hypothetical protein